MSAEFQPTDDTTIDAENEGREGRGATAEVPSPSRQNRSSGHCGCGDIDDRKKRQRSASRSVSASRPWRWQCDDYRLDYPLELEFSIPATQPRPDKDEGFGEPADNIGRRVEADRSADIDRMFDGARSPTCSPTQEWHPESLEVPEQVRCGSGPPSWTSSQDQGDDEPGPETMDQEEGAAAQADERRRFEAVGQIMEEYDDCETTYRAEVLNNGPAPDTQAAAASAAATAAAAAAAATTTSAAPEGGRAEPEPGTSAVPGGARPRGCQTSGVSTGGGAEEAREAGAGAVG